MKKSRRWVLPTVVGVVALLVGVGIGGSGSSEPADEPTAAASTTPADTSEVDDLKASLEAAEARVGELETEVEEAKAAVPEEPVATVTEEPVEAAPPAEAPAPDLSLSQQNAVGSAQSYLDYSAFSRTGLIGQLEFEGFSTDDATFAVDHIAPDWNAQAAESAQSYLDYSAFSRQGLIDQLVFEGFSVTEAEFGVAAVGY
ncbi:protein of unknown function (DUF1535) [Sanguibacter keddieii DSM 10542]|uniref:Putative host cell surface-exposed lipoprotein Ltp-like HTH region domain-containing protein n=1 Tax=Sanguibacter keddieii (strain ATCC 51767 / DSM 10542 / NCFB 3025 / ST-74) TaxID=446469 RepID=D1BE48_SANKS|nr:Ltp family lipoprotein [Sanguibacter keddieii]ACZ23269.1 protein of unknown function (DUF1535) [Sanguibacter keddieii DSM 10542]